MVEYYQSFKRYNPTRVLRSFKQHVHQMRNVDIRIVDDLCEIYE